MWYWRLSGDWSFLLLYVSSTIMWTSRDQHVKNPDNMNLSFTDTSAFCRKWQTSSNRKHWYLDKFYSNIQPIICRLNIYNLFQSQPSCQAQCDITCNTSDKPVQISKLVTFRRSNDRHETIHAVSLCTSVVCWVLSEKMTSTMLTIDITLTYKQVN